MSFREESRQVETQAMQKAGCSKDEKWPQLQYVLDY